MLTDQGAQTVSVRRFGRSADFQDVLRHPRVAIPAGPVQHREAFRVGRLHLPCGVLLSLLHKLQRLPVLRQLEHDRGEGVLLFLCGHFSHQSSRPANPTKGNEFDYSARLHLISK